jgi:YD repeat-containing protein
VVVTRTTYGESAARNQIGKPIRQVDQAGVVATDDYDFKGNLLSSSRQLASDYKGLRDWSGSVPLDSTVFARATQYDALNLPIAVTTPDGSIARLHYNVAGRPEGVDVHLRGTATATAFVTGIDYNARGQRVTTEHGNGVTCGYEYDPDTFRLIRLRATRSGGAQILQDLRFIYDGSSTTPPATSRTSPTMHSRPSTSPTRW